MTKNFFKKVMLWVRDLFCYCGVSREEYESVKKEAYISNFEVWKNLHILMFAGGALLEVYLFRNEGMSVPVFIEMLIVVYSAIVSIFFLTFLKKDSLAAQFIIYCSMIILLACAYVSSRNEPEAVGVAFAVLLVLLPMFMIDRPFYMTILLTLSVAVYLVMAERTEPADVFRADAMNIVTCGILGVIINVFYNNIRVHEFILRRQEHEHMSEQHLANEEMVKLNNTLKKMSESTVELLGDVVEYRDTESGEHIHRVKGFTYILASQVMQDLPEYGLDQYTIDLITFTSTLHDVGKISIPDAILCKPGKLTPEEFDIMKTHCEKGVEIIRMMEGKWSRDYIDMGINICLSHHEKWDGRGYPNGLKGDEIPVAAQIVSIADIYDALTTKRVYKDAYTPEEAFRMILDGKCGAFSDKMMGCFRRCREKFEAHAENPQNFGELDIEYELVSRSKPEESFVIGIHDRDRNLRERLRLGEEVSVLESISQELFYVCYVNMVENEVIRFKADSRFDKILNSFGEELKSYEKFDKLLNSIIVSEDYADFRKVTHRETAVGELKKNGHLSTNFRIRLEDGIHYCEMKISLNPNDPDAVIIGISNRDEEHAREAEYQNVQQELAIAKREIENQEKLADRLAVIDCISSEYDYVCSLNAETMEVTVYRAEEWIRDMFKNLEDIVVSPEVRDETLKGIIYPDDFESFKEGSMHSNVLKGLAQTGRYRVDYRAYKYGKLVNYQTRYEIDRHNPKRIIIGLHSV